MKKYIMSLAVVLLAAFGLTSCHDDFNDTPEYPFNNTYGVWQSLNADNGTNNYYVVCTKRSTGEDIIYVVRQNIATGEVRTLFVGDVEQYDKTIGLLTASAPTSYFGDGENGTDSLETVAYLAVQSNGVTRTLQLIDETGIEVIQEVTPTNVLPTIAGYWDAYDDETGNMIILDLYEDSTAVVNLNVGDNYALADYEYGNGQGSVTDENGNTATLAFNKDYQLVATANGATMVVDPYTSESQPEQFEAAGSALIVCPGWTESEEPARVQIEASTSVPNHYRLVSPFYAMEPDYADEGYHIEFYYDAATGEFTMDEGMYYIGEKYQGNDVFLYYYPSYYPQYNYLENEGNVFVITSLWGHGNSLWAPMPITFMWDDGFPGAEAAPKLQPAKKAPRRQMKRSLGKKVKTISPKVLDTPVNITVK